MGDVAPKQFGDATKRQRVNPGDLVAFANRCWQVKGVYLGAVGQESVVGLVPCDRHLPEAHGKLIDECFVPLPFIYGRVYAYADPA